MFAAWTMGCTHGSGLCVGPCQALYVKGQPVEESVGFLRRPRRRPRPGRPAPHSAGKLGDMQHHRLPDHRATDVVRLVEEHRRLAVGETVILLHPPLPSVGVPIAMETGRQQMTVSPTATAAAAAAPPLLFLVRRMLGHDDAHARSRHWARPACYAWMRHRTSRVVRSRPGGSTPVTRVTMTTAHHGHDGRGGAHVPARS